VGRWRIVGATLLGVAVAGSGGAAVAQGGDAARWAGPYAGATLGWGTGEARPVGVGGPGSGRACQLGDARYPLGEGVYAPPGSFEIRTGPPPDAPPDIEAMINVGQYVSRDAFGLVPVGEPVTLTYGGGVRTGDPPGVYVPVPLSVQPLAYVPGGIVALADGRSSSGAGACAILLPTASAEAPPDAVAFSWTDGRTFQWGPASDGGRIVEGAATPGGRGSIGLDGVSGSVLGGYNWAVADTIVAGVEARLFLGGIGGESSAGRAEVDHLGLLTGRIGFVQGRLLSFVSAGFGLGEVEVETALGRGSDRRAGFAIGSGVEYAVNDAWSARLDVTRVDFGRHDYIGGDDTSVAVTVVSAGFTYRF
jgi:opacity protein-like surface antigen